MTGPVCLSLCQDVQAEAYEFPVVFLRRKYGKFRALAVMLLCWQLL